MYSHPSRNITQPKLLILTVTVLLTMSVCAQHKKLPQPPSRPFTQKELDAERRNHDCLKRVNQSFSTRIRNYPFSVTAQVQLVSFPDSNRLTNETSFFIEDSVKPIYDTIRYSGMKEIKTLNLRQIDSLTQILYDYEYRGPVFIGKITNCYFPRNAILFLNSTGKVFAFIEICFECQRIQASDENVQTGDLCDQKIDLLKHFFEQTGIAYGVTTGLTSEEQ